MINSKLRSILYVSAVAITLSACSGADNVASPGEGNFVVLPPSAPTPPPPPPPPPAPSAGPAATCPQGTANVGTLTTGSGENVRNCQLSGNVTGNLVIPRQAGTVYSLSGAVIVGTDAGSTGTGGTQGILTIEPGVTFFGSSGGDFLLVNRGSQIFAEGTAAAPIIFTSRQNIDGVTGVNSIGQWGGIVILGRAPISDCATGAPTNPGGIRTDCEAIVEGPTNAVYGGNAPLDSSGRLAFIQVRYPGFEVSPGNELNGITLAGVGAGTFFQNIQVHNSSDDGIEWFGGRVNGRNLALTGNDDDSIDSDSGYQGANQFVLVVQRVGGGDHVWEADSNGNEDALPRQLHQIANYTFASSGGDHNINLRGGGDYELYNGVMSNAASAASGIACIDPDGAAVVQPANPALEENGPPVFQSTFLTCATPFADDGNITVAAIQTIFNAGSNNVANGTSTLALSAAPFGFINGANENAATPSATALNTINSFFLNTNFVGAVSDANDTRFQGWTCGLYTADRSCLIAPVIG